MSLTAGYDSRMLLACARPFLDYIRFVTIPIPDWTARTDVRVASQICKRYKLSHLVPAWREPTEDQKSLWLYRTGFTAGAPRGQSAVRCQASLGSEQPYTEGVCGEYCRRIKLARDKWFRGTPSPEELVGQFPGPIHKDLVRQATKWLAELPIHDAITITELSWMENRVGSWAGPLTYGVPESYKFVLYPLGHRRNFELWLGLPPEYRASGQFVTDLLLQLWPDLLDIPFNPAPGWRGQIAQRTRRLAGRLRRAASHLIGQH